MLVAFLTGLGLGFALGFFWAGVRVWGRAYRVIDGLAQRTEPPTPDGTPRT